MLDTQQDILDHGSKIRMVNFISSMGKMIECSPPKLPSECGCPRCGSQQGMTCLVDSQIQEGAVMWFCLNIDCIKGNTNRSEFLATKVLKIPRAVDWVRFCERYGISNKFHNVRFEDLTRFQSQETVQKMRDYAYKPHSFAWLQGDPGTGKTYASYCMLELFTREKTQAVFYTGETLLEHWISDSNNPTGLKDRLRNTELLVIDDFAQREPSGGFMGFIFNLLNHRMDWDNRGTIITTNLNTVDLNDVCKPALMDRLKTAVLKMHFKGESLRKRK